MVMISLPKMEALLRLFWILGSMLQGFNWFCKLFIKLSKSLRMMNLEWASWIIISVAIRIAIISAVNMEQILGSLCNIFLFGNIIENPTPSLVFGPPVFVQTTEFSIDNVCVGPQRLVVFFFDWVYLY